VIWEYIGPDGWSPLAALDQTKTLTTRGLVQFVGPADLQPGTCFGVKRFWIRARWHAGDFAVPPRLRAALPNTTWATQTTAIESETLGSGNGDPGQTVTTAQSPVLPGQRLSIREAGEVAELTEFGLGVNEHILGQFSRFVGVAQTGQRDGVHGRLKLLNHRAECHRVTMLSANEQAI
jgi:hypothetical protein